MLQTYNLKERQNRSVGTRLKYEVTGSSLVDFTGLVSKL